MARRPSPAAVAETRPWGEPEPGVLPLIGGASAARDAPMRRSEGLNWPVAPDLVSALVATSITLAAGPWVLPSLRFATWPTMCALALVVLATACLLVGVVRRHTRQRVVAVVAVLAAAAAGVLIVGVATPAPQDHVRRSISDGGPSRNGTVRCTQTLNPGDSFADAVMRAPAGSTVCLTPGTYSTTSPISSSHGTAVARVTLTSAQRTHPALIDGRFVTTGTADYLDVNHLRFTWHGPTPDAVVLGSAHVAFTYNDVSGSGRTTCINIVSYNGYSFAYGVVDHNLIHDCMGDTIHNQGIYVSDGPHNNVYSNNWCWHVAARCYQIRGGSNSVWHNNVADDANWGFLFGDLHPVNNDVYHNIVGPHVARLSLVSGTYGYGGSVVSAGAPAGATGNAFHDNCIESPPHVAVSDRTVTLSGNAVVRVGFVDAARHDFNLTDSPANTPCRRFAVQGGDPGP